MYFNYSNKDQYILNKLAGYSLGLFLITYFFLNSTILFLIATTLFVFFETLVILLKRNLVLGLAVKLYSIFIIYLVVLSIAGIPYDIANTNSRIFVILLNFVVMILFANYLMYQDNREKFINQYIYIILVFTLYIVFNSGTDLLSARLGWEMPYIFGFSGIYNSNSIGINCAISSSFCLYKYSNEKKRKNILLFIYFVFIILLTGSRKSLAMIILLTIGYLAIQNGKLAIRNLIIGIGFVAVLYILIMETRFLYSIIGFRIEDIINNLLYGKDLTESSAITRSNMINSAYYYILQKPLFGYGMDNFRFMPGSYNTYSHNNYLELLFGCGIIGTILYYSVYIYLIFKLYHLFKKIKSSLSALIMIFIIVLILVDYTLVSYSIRSILMVLFLGVAIINEHRKENKICESIKKKGNYI